MEEVAAVDVDAADVGDVVVLPSDPEVDPAADEDDEPNPKSDFKDGNENGFVVDEEGSNKGATELLMLLLVVVAFTC